MSDINEDLINKVRKFDPLTFVGVGLIFIFLIFCFIYNLTVRWWLMVPIAIASVVLLNKRKNESSGIEKQVCIYGKWVIIGIFIIRDIVISHKIAAILDFFQ